MVRWLMNWSYRTTSTRLRFHWLARWFSNLAIDGPTPSYSKISDFEKWFMEYHPDLMFSEVVRQLAIAFPEDEWKTQIGDTFACLSVGLFETIPRLLRQCASPPLGGYLPFITEAACQG